MLPIEYFLVLYALEGVGANPNRLLGLLKCRQPVQTDINPIGPLHDNPKVTELEPEVDIDHLPDDILSSAFTATSPHQTSRHDPIIPIGIFQVCCCGKESGVRDILLSLVRADDCTID